MLSRPHREDQRTVSADSAAQALPDRLPRPVKTAAAAPAEAEKRAELKGVSLGFVRGLAKKPRESGGTGRYNLLRNKES